MQGHKHSPNQLPTPRHWRTLAGCKNHSTAPNTPISAGCASVLVRLLSVWVVQSVFYLLRFDFAMLLLLLLCMAYPRSGCRRLQFSFHFLLLFFCVARPLAHTHANAQQSLSRTVAALAPTHMHTPPTRRQRILNLP